MWQKLEAGKENFHSRFKSILQSNLFSLNSGKVYTLTVVYVDPRPLWKKLQLVKLSCDFFVEKEVKTGHGTRFDNGRRPTLVKSSESFFLERLPEAIKHSRRRDVLAKCRSTSMELLNLKALFGEIEWINTRLRDDSTDHSSEQDHVSWSLFLIHKRGVSLEYKVVSSKLNCSIRSDRCHARN